MILELKNIYKNYDQGKLSVPVLKDVSLSVERANILRLWDRPGSGKTTLMNIIGCLDRPTSGTFLLDGEVLQYKDKAMSDVRLNSIGFVFQSFHLLPRQARLKMFLCL